MKPCSLLDDYLGGWLDASEKQSFESHLAACPACGEEVRLARKIDALLADAPQAAPPHVAAEAATLLRARRRRRWAVAGVVAAGLLWGVIGIGRTWRSDAPPPRAEHHRPTPNHAAPRLVDVASPSVTIPPPQDPHPPGDSLAGEEFVTVDAGAAAIALEQPCDDPKVHVFWLYPTIGVSTQTSEPPLCSTHSEGNRS